MRNAAWPIIAICLVSLPALGGVSLLLEDGQELEGLSVEREGSFYMLELETGNVLPLPVDLVVEVRLTDEDDPAPTGLKPAEPETLVGPPGAAELPDRSEQIEVLQDSVAVFRREVIDPAWKPTSDWDDDPKRNNFNPARWFEAPIDPSWEPTSAYKTSGDVTRFNPARWYRPPINSTWWPSDGFGWRRP